MKSAPAPADASTRGHDEQVLMKRIYCLSCGKTKPKKGGWQEHCDPKTAEKRRQHGK